MPECRLEKARIGYEDYRWEAPNGSRFMFDANGDSAAWDGVDDRVLLEQLKSQQVLVDEPSADDLWAV
jgi:hypothetical protein